MTASPITSQRHWDAPLTIGVIGDTHIHTQSQRRLPPEVPALFLRLDVGLILHTGDVNTRAVLETLGRIAPILAVTGNNDDADLRELAPEQMQFTVGPYRFALIHGHGGPTARAHVRRFAGQVDCAIYGHSHIPLIEVEQETILFNPGSATDRRWQPHFGVGLLHVTMDRIDPELILYEDPSHLRNVGVG